MSYELQFGDVLQYWPELAMGAWRTVYLSAISMVIGMAMAVVGALGKTAGGPILRFFINAYIETIRNTPFLVQVLLIFFGLPALGIRFSPDTATVIALVVNVSAYAIEIIRAGIESISKGQLEAGAALGLRPLQIFRYIVLKPSIQAIYPALTSQFILLMLNSSVCVAIAASELTSAAGNIQSRTLRSFEVYFIATAIYLGLSMLFWSLFNLIERTFLAKPVGR